MRRARPLLGTYVDIEAHGPAELALDDAMNSAFEGIARVHRLMSFHDPRSDVSRLNRRAAYEPVAVDPWTMTVLRRARMIFEATGGLFDCAVGYELLQRGLLPSENLDHIESGAFSAVEFLLDNQISFSAKIAIDLGGIAKGFAVDRAIAILRSYGVREAVVNAGGDLRVIGVTPQPIYIRCPGAFSTQADISLRQDNAIQKNTTQKNMSLVFGGLLQNGAVATSRAATTISKSCAQDVRPLASLELGADWQVYSVVAPTCLLADALTKVLIQVGRVDAHYFGRFGATAFITSADAGNRKAA